MEKESESKKQEKPVKKKLVNQVKEHLMMQVGLPLGALLLILLVVMVRVPYLAKETYTENETYIELVPVTELDTKNPIWAKECTQEPAQFTVEEDTFSPHIAAYGVGGFLCKAEFKVRNTATSEGTWTYYYTFNISGRIVSTGPLTKKIQGLATVKFEFQSDECQQGDKLTGTYNFVSGPTATVCKNVVTYKNVTVTKEVTKKRESQKERVITKYEPLWQKILGYNNFEKA